MPIYVAMLRGINVANKMVKMERLRASFEALGFDQVRTYVQSGNVVFHAEEKSPDKAAKKIENRITRDFGFEVPVLVKSAKDLEQVVKSNPLLKEKGIDHSKLHVTFLLGAPPITAAKALEPLATSRERFRVLNREIYLYCPDGYGISKLANATIEKRLAVVATTRNWRTVNALLEMAKAG
jgi:uncharacterized protein (DUF1697 family)